MIQTDGLLRRLILRKMKPVFKEKFQVELLDLSPDLEFVVIRHSNGAVGSVHVSLFDVTHVPVDEKDLTN